LTDETVSIDRVGAEGDGIAIASDGATLYIPDTLPGELVRVERKRHQGDGWLAPHTALLRASDARVPPPCVHFGDCGGCVLQHWRDTEYRAWKTSLLDVALRRAGFPDPQIKPIRVTPPRSRRRMDLAARRTAQGVMVGLHARSSSPAEHGRHAAVRLPPAPRVRGKHALPNLCDLAECHVLHPVLFDLVAPLHPLLSSMRAMRRDASIIANLLDHGVDLLLRTDSAPDLADRTRLIDFARTHRLLRVSWAAMHSEPEPIAVLQPPRITLSGISVEPPPGAFLQASEEGQATIVQAVVDALPNDLSARARVAELYAGCGSLTFAVAQRARVAAWEGDAAAAASLRQAANRAGLAGRVAVTQRDLARQPVTAAELSGCAAVVLDPPFAGAAAQTAQIAAAKTPRVVYVSCNPAVLARDARMLHDAGYTVLTATPIDQFLWSARLESVCVFGPT
jgi:23S rRNA (uracil1939-C5)-methyltransferase